MSGPDLIPMPMRECGSVQGVFIVRASKRDKTYCVSFSHTNAGPHEINPSCTCPAYLYRSRCKHIAQIEQAGCFWTEQLGSDRTGKIPKPIQPVASNAEIDANEPCPACGFGTYVVKVGV